TTNSLPQHEHALCYATTTTNEQTSARAVNEMKGQTFLLVFLDLFLIHRFKRVTFCSRKPISATSNWHHSRTHRRAELHLFSWKCVAPTTRFALSCAANDNKQNCVFPHDERLQEAVRSDRCDKIARFGREWPVSVPERDGL